MRFDEAMAYLDRHVNLEANAGWVHGLSTDRMRQMVDVLGEPQAQYPVIHVTGTNGKGSTVRMISALLAAHGLSVGTYTSPNLESVTERIARNGAPISEAELAGVLAELATYESLFAETPTYFELLTAAAFSWFAEEAVDVAVVEVGLLGRFDATNVVEADVAVITNIGKDHTDGQGEWRQAIAGEKAGIIKPGSTVVLGETDPALLPIFEAEPAAAFLRRDRDFFVDRSIVAVGGRLVDIRTPLGHHDDLYLPVHGDHQATNAAVALTATEAFFGRPSAVDVVVEAFGGLSLPARFEVLRHHPLVILDGAHNPDGARVAADTYAEAFDPSGGLTLVVGLLTGREPEEVLAPLLALRPARVVVCRPDSPRAADPDAIAVDVARLHPTAQVVVVEDIAAATLGAITAAGEDDAVLVCGSLYVVGAARAACRELGLVR